MGPMIARQIAGVDVESVLEQLSDGGVVAPAELAPELEAIVAGAADQGTDLQIIVVEENPPLAEQLRDLATTVGQGQGGTVLAVSPHLMGSNSDTYSRFELEAAEYLPRTGDTATDVQAFVEGLDAPPGPDFTALFAVLAVLTVVVVAVGTAVNLRGRSGR